MTATDVLSGDAKWSCERMDAVEWLRGLPDDSIDLLVTSPPYENCRTYGLKGKLPAGQAWVDWMVEVVEVAAPKVSGLIAINCEGQTRGYRYSCVPFLLMADLHRAGFNLRKPPVFHRVGIPGSGGPDWLRNDYEPIICVTREGRLPYSDNTACGHPPKWAPGGEMSHRLSDGTRTNQWGKTGAKTGTTVDGIRGKPGIGKPRPSHRTVIKNTRPREGQRSNKSTFWTEPTIANPGNVIAISVGGGCMGHPIAHENEAPFPVKLSAFFAASFCPLGGVIADPFAGSGTTAQAALERGARFIGCDIRQSQVDLCKKRMATVTPSMFAA